MVFIGGLVATTIMTLVMLVLERPLRQPLNVITILGAMLTGNVTSTKNYIVTAGSIVVGTLVHYGVGFLFCAGFSIAGN